MRDVLPVLKAVVLPNVWVPTPQAQSRMVTDDADTEDG
jgi:hypothetical protein